MTSAYQNWQASNTRQLARALAGLRDRLEAHIRATTTPTVTIATTVSTAPVTPAPRMDPVTAPAARPSPPRVVSRSALHRLLSPKLTPPAVETPPPAAGAAAQPGAPTADPGLAPSAERGPEVLQLETAPPEPPSALAILGDQLGLSDFEREVLLLSVAMDLDTRIPVLCARAQDDVQRTYPTFALALALFDGATWDALSPDRPLRYYRLIELHPASAHQGVTTSALRADERVVSYLKGLNVLDERLGAYLTPLRAAAGTSAELAPSQRRAADTILRRLKDAQPPASSVVQLLGSEPLSKKLVAHCVAGELRLTLYTLPVEALPGSPVELEAFARLWQRECRLLPLALYWESGDDTWEGGDRLTLLQRFVARSDGLMFLAAREAVAPLAEGTNRALVFDVGRPSRNEQHEAWAAELSHEAPAAAGSLAAQFDLNLSTIRSLVAYARTEAAATRLPVGEVAWTLACQTERPRLEALAQRIEPKVGWDALVLPAAEKTVLRQIADQVRNRARVYGEWGIAQTVSRGLAINALFAGPSGTGKTLAAEVIAHELKLDLYRIDLSQVVNKYIGETEKNLRRLFDAAEAGGAILFFDEADALFGKRSAVKDSHDRYANIEVNYLLQRMEAFQGLAILATNMKGGLDEAFLRRLRFVVNFPMPNQADRRRMWERALPSRVLSPDAGGLPVGVLDYDRLARLSLTGGHIQNVVLNAAFLAAGSEPAVITMPMVLQSARREYVKLERASSAGEFLWNEPDAAASAGVRREPSETMS